MISPGNTSKKYLPAWLRKTKGSLVQSLSINEPFLPDISIAAEEEILLSNGTIRGRIDIRKSVGKCSCNATGPECRPCEECKQAKSRKIAGLRLRAKAREPLFPQATTE